MENGKLKFGWKEWLGIFAAMTAAAATPLLVIEIHTSDKERHQSEREKTALVRSLMKEERDAWQRALAAERELFQTIFESHEKRVGHAGMEANHLDHERRITRLESLKH